MVLAEMLKLDEDALICDLAETYQIYDYKQLPLSTVAAFSYGLKSDSRIKLKLNHQIVPPALQISAGIYDVVSLLWWSKTKDAEHGINKPASILSAITGESTQKQTGTAVTFESGEDFERIRNNLMTGGEQYGD